MRNWEEKSVKETETEESQKKIRGKEEKCFAKKSTISKNVDKEGN